MNARHNPALGIMDEFVRKRVRNDHALLALWECGIRHLRVPLADLAEPDTRARVAALKEMGHEFDVFVFGAPSTEEAELVTRCHELVAAFEVVVPPGGAAALVPAVAALKARSGLPLHLSKVESSAHRPSEGSTFHHFVSFGFRLNEPDEVTRILDLHGARAAIDGVVFRVALDEAPFTAIGGMASLADAHGVHAVANIRLASDNPTERVDDDQRIANRVAETVAAAFAQPAVRVFVDTLVDQDRGNYPRHGLIDRRYNPRPASFVLRHLQAALVDLGGPFTAGKPVADAGRRLVPMDNDRAVLWLVLPEGGGTGAPLRELPATAERGRAGTMRRVDLMTGAIATGHWRRPADGAPIELDPPLPAAAPLLLALPRAGGDAG